MKKEMFNEWYAEHEKEFASRKEAKAMFSSVYDKMKRKFDLPFQIMNDSIEGKIIEFRINEKQIELAFNKLTESKNRLLERMYELYESYFTKNEISKSYFNETKRYFGERLTECRDGLNELERLKNQSMNNRKILEKLLSSNWIG